MEIINIQRSTEAKNILSTNPNTGTHKNAKMITEKMLKGSAYFIIPLNLSSVLMRSESAIIPKDPPRKRKRCNNMNCSMNCGERIYICGKKARIIAPIAQITNNIKPIL